MAQGFGGQVKGLTGQYRKRLNFIAKRATEMMTEEANTPIASGGRLPVLTSFLRSSLTAAPDGPPMGPTKGLGPIQGNALAAAIVRWDPMTQTLWVGWSAVYAGVQNLRYGYRDGAVEKWSMFVANATREAQAKKL